MVLTSILTDACWRICDIKIQYWFDKPNSVHHLENYLYCDKKGFNLSHNSVLEICGYLFVH